MHTTTTSLSNEALRISFAMISLLLVALLMNPGGELAGISPGNSTSNQTAFGSSETQTKGIQGKKTSNKDSKKTVTQRVGKKTKKIGRTSLF